MVCKGLKFLSLVMASNLLSACLVGPDYVPPPVLVPEKYTETGKEKLKNLPKEAPKGWKMATPRDDCDRGEWWQIFKDPILNNLELEVTINNENIHAAEAQYRQALALLDQAMSAFYPTVNAFASYSRQKAASSRGGAASIAQNNAINNVSSPTNSVVNPGTGVNTGGTAVAATGNTSSKPFNLYSVSLSATWEPDLWGAVRRAVQAADAFAQSQAAFVALTRLLMQTTLAQSYFQLRNLDADQALLDATVIEYEKALKIVQNRYAAGVAQQLDVLQAKTQLDTARAQAYDNGIARGQLEHAIAVLTGKPPGCFSLEPRPYLPRPPRIPLLIPSELLERRPDVAQNERLVAEANAQIGVAIAAYFPVLTLSGTDGFISSSLKTLFNKASHFWSYGAQLAQFIYDGGLRDAQVCAAYAIFDQAVANYRQVVLAAFQEVEDNLVSLNHLNAEILVLKEAVVNAEKALKITWNQYFAGTQDYSQVIIQQNTLYTAKKTLYDAEGRRLVSAAGLIKALGGGWESCDLCDK